VIALRSNVPVSDPQASLSFSLLAALARREVSTDPAFDVGLALARISGTTTESLAGELGATRGAIDKSLHDARVGLRWRVGSDEERSPCSGP
jgi:hypothetical protein